MVWLKQPPSRYSRRQKLLQYEPQLRCGSLTGSGQLESHTAKVKPRTRGFYAALPVTDALCHAADVSVIVPELNSFELASLAGSGAPPALRLQLLILRLLSEQRMRQTRRKQGEK